jgi:internalin A
LRQCPFPSELIEAEELESLDLSGNQLTTLPEAIAQLHNLTHLSLWDNQFKSIPSVIYELLSLQSLDFENVSAAFSGNGNRIEEISSKILQLENLKTLILQDNPIEIPPPEVVTKGVEAIKDYFRQIQAIGVDYLYEAKLLIIGEGGAGKTTLAKKIENPAFTLRDDEQSTEGIAITRWPFRMDNGQEFRVNIWDFGGQEIYHTTHQFFLTKRSVYALVADSRKEDTDFYYWLNVVELLSDNSPLLIVTNEKQERHREINERQLRGRFTNLKETLAINLATNRGLPQVLTEIKHYMCQLPHIGTPLPKSWVKVREALEKDPSNYISLDKYLKICQENGFTQDHDKLQLSGYLHDIGVCLHFQNDSLLRKIVILKPSWGTAAVYKVLDNGRVIRNNGRFTRADLRDIWHEDIYANMQDELLQLMINFKLCYKLPEGDDIYIAPQWFAENQPFYNWDETNNLILRYTYDFMLKGIITRLIVAMHQLIADQQYVWKSGVILQNNETLAEVIEYYNRREVKIRIAGKYRKELMTIVTYELDKIHASYSRLKYSKLIPCNCTICKGSQEPYFYPFEVLRQFTKDSQYRIQCQKSYQMVDVRSLIDDVVDINRSLEQEKINPKEMVFNAPIGTVIVSESGIVQKSGNGHNTIQQARNGGNIIVPPDREKLAPKSAWANGSFYLFTFAVVIAGLGVLSNTVSMYVLPIILIAGILFVPMIGVLQLRQDERLSEKPFMELLKLVIGQLPLIGRLAKNVPKSQK